MVMGSTVIPSNNPELLTRCWETHQEHLEDGVITHGTRKGPTLPMSPPLSHPS